MIKTIKILILFIFPLIGYTQTWDLVWSDEFDSNVVDQSKWTHEIGTGSQNNMWGWGNGELQYYQPQNSIVSNGTLKIIVQQEPQGLVDSWNNTYYYSSSRISTKNNFNFKYGKVEARIKTLDGEGFWPAFWLLPKNGQWPCDGEIDIMEQWGRDTPTDETTGAAHIGSCTNSYSNFENFQTFSSSDFSSNFHTYSIIWQEDYIAWYVDGNKVFQVTPASFPTIPNQHSWPFNSNNWYIILNLAIDNNGPNSNSAFPNNIEVDYVRVYESNGVLGCTDPTALNYDQNANIDNSTCEYNVTFNIDMNNVGFNFTTPEVNGTFNNWCGNCWPMTDTDSDNIWSTTVVLTEGEYKFKYSVDNWSVQENLDPLDFCTISNFGYTDRKLIVFENMNICPEWNECTPVCSPTNLDEIINNNYESVIVNDFLMLDENFNEISIFNTSGKKVVELENVFESKIDLSNLNTGVYFLQGRNKINNRTIKILKI